MHTLNTIHEFSSLSIVPCYSKRSRALKATRRYTKPSDQAKQSSNRGYGEFRALLGSPELEGEARRTLQASGAKRRKAHPARIEESKPPRREPSPQYGK
ncbi:hypothetical protein F2Q68_00031001 [Brassica cretica]|uniref:Uncharacterized protein n=1 Tax=Brassica cretica TaxID=69181 RepID=A0A8S9G2J0_BRACR|nr:hypothetical protein F2Q68_00031001 [Brassica cretica]